MDLYSGEEQEETRPDRRFRGRLAGGVEEPHLKDYLRVLFMRRWVVVGVSLLVIFVTALTVFILTPTYRANSLLLIEPKKSQDHELSGSLRSDPLPVCRE